MINKLAALVGAGLAMSASAYTLQPINTATLAKWSSLSTLTTSSGFPIDRTIRYAVIDNTTTFLAGESETIREGFRQYSALFSGVNNINNRILFQKTSNPELAQIKVVKVDLGGATGAGCAVVNGVENCTIYITNANSIRFWLGRSLGIAVDGSILSNVLGRPSGCDVPFSVADLTNVMNAYPSLNLNLNGTGATAPVFLANYSDASLGAEVVVGWSTLRSRLASSSTQVPMSGVFKTVAAIPLSNSMWYTIGFPIYQYQMNYGTQAYYSWYPYLNGQWGYYLSGINGYDASPVLGAGVDPYPGLSPVSVPATPYVLFAADPAKGYLHGGQFGATSDPNSGTIPSQYTTPLYFSAQGLSFVVTTRPIADRPYRLGGYAFAVE